MRQLQMLRKNMQEELHRRPINLSVLIKTWRCLLNPGSLRYVRLTARGGKAREAGKAAAAALLLLLPISLNSCPSYQLPHHNTKHKLPRRIQTRPDSLPYKNSVTECRTVLHEQSVSFYRRGGTGDGRELHIQQLALAAAFNLIRLDCRYLFGPCHYA